MNHQRWERRITAVLLIAIFLPGCDRGQKAPPPPSAPEVATITVKSQRVPLTTELPGRTSAYLIAEVRPQVNGLVQKRLFTEGSDVKAGDVLYEIDSAPFKAALDNAVANLEVMKETADRARAGVASSLASVTRQQATLALAESNRQRLEDLYKDKAVSTSDRDQAVTGADVARASLQVAEAQVDSDRQSVAVAEAGIKQAQAALDIARINLAYTRIIAPIPGRIGKTTVTDGAIVTAYQPAALATIQQMDPIYVDVLQPTSELLKLKDRLDDGRLNSDAAGHNKVTLIFGNGEMYPLEGTLQFRDVSVDPMTGSVVVRAVFPNPQGLLLPGMFVRALVNDGVNEHAILIPQQAVSRDTKGRPVAMIVGSDGKVAPRMLTLDRAIGDQWLVTTGLVPGDRVIVEGMLKARPGAMVKDVPFAGGGKPDAKPATTTQPALLPTSTSLPSSLPASLPN
jgi:membrane fusion protein (multidrug efflux system)